MYFKHNSDNRHFSISIDSIIFELNLDMCSFRLYCEFVYLKSIGPIFPENFLGIPREMTEKEYKSAFECLCEPRDVLGGGSLVRRMDDGGIEVW